MNDTHRFMSQDFLPKFIEVYKSYPCLWRMRSRNLSGKSSKGAAYDHLVRLTTEVVPNCDLDYVKRKIDILRGSFRRELKKVKFQIKHGGKTYKPRLWYFSLLLFLDKEVELRPRRIGNPLQIDSEAGVSDDGLDESYLDIGENNGSDNDRGVRSPISIVFKEEISESAEDEDCQEELQGHEFFPGADEETSETPSTSATVVVHNIKTEEEEVDGENYFEPSYPSSQGGHDEFDLFGRSVAAQLRNMDPMQNIFCQHVINQVLFHGKLMRMIEGSYVCHPDPEGMRRNSQC